MTSSAYPLPAGPGEAAPVAVGPAMRALLDAAAVVAGAATPVLLLGEPGTGKATLARWIHRCSPRASGPWVAVDCAGLSGGLLESELFGHERGGFPGAFERRVGRIEEATGGTVLLDEVSALPLALQARVLRLLQERAVARANGASPVPVDVRVIASSSRDLAELASAGAFRQDLLSLLQASPLRLPPLRERREDLPALAEVLLARLAAGLGRTAPAPDASALRALSALPLPGNLRELSALLEGALSRGCGPVLDAAGLAASGPARQEAVANGAATSESCPPPEPAFPPGLPVDLGQLERLAIAEALRRTGGNRTRAAQLLGIGLRTLRTRLNGGKADGEGGSTGPLALARFKHNEEA